MILNKIRCSFGKNISDNNEKFVSIIKDWLTGFLVVKSFQGEEQVINLFSGENTELEQGKEKRKAAEGTGQVTINWTVFLGHVE